MSEEERVELVYDGIICETDKAICFDLGSDLQWVPKSLIEEDSDGLTIPAWFAVKEGLE